MTTLLTERALDRIGAVVYVSPIQQHVPPHAMPGTFPKGRPCIYADELGCETILSTYNAGPSCWCHSSRYAAEIEEAASVALSA